MNENSLNKMLCFYDEYVELSWSKDFQLNFWKIKLDEIVKNIEEQEIKLLSKEANLSEGIFATYDITSAFSGWLNTRSDVRIITKKSIGADKDIFLQEVINLSIVRYQNALERLLIQTINEYYINIIQFDVYNRKCLNKFLKKLLIPREDNSMHLLTYLESKSVSVKEFLHMSCNVDLNATWRELFYFFGLIRNSIVHNGMLMLWDNYKNYLGIKNDIFHYFFEKPKKAKLFVLKPRLDRIGLFANYSDQFATNVLKRIANQNDLKFLKFSQS